MILLLVVVVSACSRTKHKEHGKVHDEYTCPMHPQIVRDKPGACPICGMDLVLKSVKEKDTLKVPADLNTLIKSPNQVVVADIAAIHPVEKEVNDSLSAPGVITYDTRRLYNVAARFGGRIEKLYLKFQYQPVNKGDVVAEVYSPELVTAQRELLYVVKTDKANQALVEGAMSKLRLLGVTSGQVSELMRTGKVKYSFPVYSPYSGYLALNSGSAPQAEAVQSSADAGGMGGGMDDGSSSSSPSFSGGSAAGGVSSSSGNSAAGLTLREGAYVATGQTLFNIINAGQLWAEIKIAGQQASGYKKGMPAVILPDGGNQLKGTVQLVQPYYDGGSDFAAVRVGFDNTGGKFRIGQLVKVNIPGEHRKGIWLPQVAVLDLGTRKVAFLKRNHSFVPVTVVTGAHSKDMVQIKSGLSVSDLVAADAQYLVDSESFIETEGNK